jgi:hypothetical protein
MKPERDVNRKSHTYSDDSCLSGFKPDACSKSRYRQQLLSLYVLRRVRESFRLTTAQRLPICDLRLPLVTALLGLPLFRRPNPSRLVCILVRHYRRHRRSRLVCHQRPDACQKCTCIVPERYIYKGVAITGAFRNGRHGHAEAQ